MPAGVVRAPSCFSIRARVIYLTMISPSSASSLAEFCPAPPSHRLDLHAKNLGAPRVARALAWLLLWTALRHLPRLSPWRWLTRACLTRPHADALILSAFSSGFIRRRAFRTITHAPSVPCSPSPSVLPSFGRPSSRALRPCVCWCNSSAIGGHFPPRPDLPRPLRVSYTPCRRCWRWRGVVLRFLTTERPWIALAAGGAAQPF